MQLVPEAKLTSKTGLQQLILCGLAYILPLYSLRTFLDVSSGVEYALTSLISTVCGLLFGLPGALGIALSIFGFFMLNTGWLLVSLLAAFIFFLDAYTPFRLWYSVATKGDYMFFDNRHALLKFIFIEIFCAIQYALAAFSFESYFLGFMSPSELLVFFATEVNLPLWLCVPAVVLWNKYTGKVYYRPYEKAKHWQKYTQQAFILLLVLEFFFVISLLIGAVDNDQMLIAGLSGLLLWAYIIQRPSTYVQSAAKEYRLTSVPGAMMSRLLLGSCILLGVIFLVASGFDGSLRLFLQGDKYVYRFLLEMFVCIVIIISAIYIFLGNMEKALTRPVQAVSKMLENYLDSSEMHMSREAEQLLQEQDNELTSLVHSLQKMQRYILNYAKVLDQTVARQQSFATQMAIATSIQQGVLPDLEALRPQLPQYQIYGQMLAAKSVGGDMYDAFLVDEDHLFISVADVAGKGLPASLFMMICQTLLKKNAQLLSVDEAVAHVNTSLARSNEQCLFVTMWAGVVELSTGRCTYVNAGHNPPLVKHKQATQAQWLEALSGPVLGLMGDMPYTSHEFVLEPGDTLLLYSDGFNEAEDINHNFYGNERLEASFLAAEQHDAVLKEIKRFAAGAEQSDDMTYVWLRREEVAACN